MASRLILKNIKAPIPFLLRNPASSAPLAQTIQNLIVPIPRHSAGESSKYGIVSELGSGDRTLLSRDLISSFDGGFRIEVRGKKPEMDTFEDVDEMVESGSDDEDSDEFNCDYYEESGGDFYNDDDAAEPRDDEV